MKSIQLFIKFSTKHSSKVIEIENKLSTNFFLKLTFLNSTHSFALLMEIGIFYKTLRFLSQFTMFSLSYLAN